MRATAIRVIQQVNIAPRGVRKACGQRLGRPRHGADMHRDMVRLRHQAAARVNQRDGEIAGRIKDLRIGGAQHRLTHLLGDGVQPVLQHGDADRIGHAADGGRGRVGWEPRCAVSALSILFRKGIRGMGQAGSLRRGLSATRLKPSWRFFRTGRCNPIETIVTGF